MVRNLVLSIDELADKGQLDILPASASKPHAIEYLMQRLKFTISEIVFASDSSNDISVLISPIHSILIANASEDVIAQANKEAEACQQTETLYLASGNCYGMNGNYSAGIVKGVLHYLPQVKSLIEQTGDNYE